MKKILSLLLCIVLVAGISIAAAERDPWDCPKCGRKGNTGNFCGSCGEPAPEAVKPWVCPKCGETGNTGKFCGNCGQKAPELWDCPICGKKGNSKTFCEECGAEKPALIQAGDYVTFGHYEQDNDTANGQEAIEWLVLDVQDGKALLLSRYGLDAKPYLGTTWEYSSLREWLNGEFVNTAFSSAEQACIEETEVDNSAKQCCSRWSTSGGKNTNDKVFLLSYAEGNKYLGAEHWKVTGSGKNMNSRTSTTAYAKAQGAYTSSRYKTAEGENACWWWLRSPGSSLLSAANVNIDGACSDVSIDKTNGAVRPALWRDLAVISAETTEAAPAPVVEQGTWGTCPWTIDANGLLTVGAGVGADLGGWYSCRSMVKTVIMKPGVTLPKKCEFLFFALVNCTAIDLHNVDTSNVTDMNNMFYYCSSMTTLDLGSFDTSNVTDMSNMFVGCSSMTTFDLGSFDTGNVTDMHSMFKDCTSLTTLDLGSFDTGNVMDMSGMFIGCTSLTTLDLSSFDISNVTDMSNMFYKCTSLTTLDLSSFDTGNVADMSYMYEGCTSLTTLDLGSFDTGNVTDMQMMFYDCKSLTTLDLSSFNTGNVADMRRMFYNCSSLTTLDLSSFDTSNVTNMYYMFYNCTSLTVLDLGSFDTGNVTDMERMFSNCTSLTVLDLGSFDTGNVTYLGNIFSGCGNLKQIKVGQAFSFKGNTSKLPEGKWRSLSDGKTYTEEQIAKNRKNIADTYTRQ